MPGARIFASASASALRRASRRSASRALSTAAVSRCLAGAQPLARRCRRGAAAVDQRRRLGHGSRRRRRIAAGDTIGAQQRFALVFALGKPGPQPALTVGKVAALAFERGAPRLAGGAGFGHLLQAGFRGREVGGSGSDAALPPWRERVSAAAPAPLQRTPLVGEAGEPGLGIGEVLGLAFEVGGDLREAPLGFGARRDDPAELVFERLARMDDALQPGRRRGLRHAQRRQRRFRLGAHPLLRQGGLGRGGQRSLAGAQFGGEFVGLRRGGAPAGVQQLRLGAPDLLAEPAIALRLPRLLLEGLDLRREGQDHIVEPAEIVLGGLQLQLGFVAARMQPGGAGRLVEQQPALGRLCRDQRADPPLTDQRARMRPGRGVGEQQLDVAGAHLAAVDPIGGAAAAGDPAHHLDRRAVIVGKGRIARAVVDRQRDLGEVARRAVAGPGKDQIVHLAAAQPLVRRLRPSPSATPRRGWICRSHWARQCR